jgi:flagellin
MSGIVLSRAVRSNLTALQSTSDLISTTQTRLATGKRVNSALDNPSNFFTSSSLNSRAGDLGNLLDSVSNAIKTLEAADNGIKSLTKLVESAQAIARQAQQSVATATKGVQGTATASTVTLASLNYDVGAGAAGDDLRFVFGSTTVDINFAAGNTVGDLVTAINADSTLNTANIKAYFDANNSNKLTIENGSGQALTLSLDNENAGGAATDLTPLFGSATVAIDSGTLNTTRSSLATQFDTIRTQINQLATDSSYNGVNLLSGGSLSVIFNEKSTSSLTISGVTYDSAGLGITASDRSFQHDSDITASLNEISTALSTLRAQASAFGSNLSVVQTRQDFTKATINTLKAGADNLVLADTNEEGANLLALQTRQQLSSTALSLASQADQQVLRLF